MAELHQLEKSLLLALKDGKRIRLSKLLKKTEIIDLGSFKWSVEPIEDSFAANPLTPPSSAEIKLLKEALAEWYLSIHGAKLNPSKEIFIGSLGKNHGIR